MIDSGSTGPPSRILVTGGGGYIGSHMVKVLLEKGWEVVTLDDFSTGHRDAVPGGTCIEGDLGDESLLDELFGRKGFEAAMHFAAFSRVEESVHNPAAYYRNNVAKTQVLLDALIRHGIRDVVFSSSAAIYGDPSYLPIDEAHVRNPVSPYGACKWMVERMLGDYGNAYGMRSVSLRYFNAAGADPEAEMGERHEPETHLIPNLLQAASGRRQAVPVYGTDFPTADGTCVRDYVHVIDLCEAHLKALEYLRNGGSPDAFNLGSGRGYSIQEVLETARSVTGLSFKVEWTGHREGDPACLIADSVRAREVLGWNPRFGLEDMVSHAWDWERRLAGLA